MHLGQHADSFTTAITMLSSPLLAVLQDPDTLVISSSERVPMWTYNRRTGIAGIAVIRDANNVDISAKFSYPRYDVAKGAMSVDVMRVAGGYGRWFFKTDRERRKVGCCHITVMACGCLGV
jgi:hypothetical protein